MDLAKGLLPSPPSQPTHSSRVSPLVSPTVSLSAESCRGSNFLTFCLARDSISVVAQLNTIYSIVPQYDCPFHAHKCASALLR